MKLTKAAVARLTLPAGKDEAIIFDDEVKGFGIRLRAGGKKTWIVQYRIGTKQRRVTLGDVRKLDSDAARASAKERLAQVTLGEDPQKAKIEARARASVTLGAMVDVYIAKKESSVRYNTLRGIKLYLRNHWQPLHGLPVHGIERRDVAVALNEIAKQHGPSAVARARSVLSAFFTWAMREGIAERNPVIGTNTPTEKARDRVLNNDELAHIWAACREDDYGGIVKLLILTGQRREEVGGMAWDELDLESGTWNIPRERTKNGLPHAVPLSPLALDILKTTPRRREFVFGDGPREGEERGFSGYSKAKASLDSRMKKMKEWRLHDIRRTVATRMADIGIEPHIIEACLNHQSGHRSGVAGIYNRSRYEAAIRAAFERWDAELRAILRGERKVVPLRRA
jgi:integrase